MCNFCEYDINELHGLSVERNGALKRRPDGRWIRSREKRMIRKLRTQWRAQRDWIIDNLDSIADLYAEETNAPNEKKIQIRIEDYIKDMPKKESVAMSIVGGMSGAMKRAGDKIVKKFKLEQFGISFSLDNPNAKSFLKKKTILELSNGSGTIDATTKKGIQKILVDGVSEGATISQISVRIRDQYDNGVFSVARGELIAQTELGRAYGQGNRIPMDEFEQNVEGQHVEKKWQTVGDDRVRATHKSNQDEGWIVLKQNHVGTNEQQAPSKDFGCRCVEGYQIVDDE